MVDHGTLNPHFFAYPSMLFDVVAGVGWMQRLFGGWQTGAGITVENVGIAHTTDPHLFFTVRCVAAVLSIGICAVVWTMCYLITGRWWAATLAGLLLAVSPLMAINAVYITPDTFATFFTAIGLLFALHLMKRGGRLDYALAGSAVGFAAGAKYNAVLVAVAVVAAHLLRYPQAKGCAVSADPAERHQAWFRRIGRQGVPLLFAGLFAVTAFLITTPEAVLNFHEFTSGASEIAHLYGTEQIAGAGSSFAYYVRIFLDGAIVVTQLGSGRFVADPRMFPAENAAYKRLASNLCLGKSYSNGSWVRIFVPCRQ